MAVSPTRKRALALGLNPNSKLSEAAMQRFIELRVSRGAKPTTPKPVVRSKQPRTKPFDLSTVVGPQIDPSRGTITDTGPLAPRTRAQVTRQNTEIVRRQRVLRANGYGVVADGVWGPKSQQAWIKYKRGVGGSVVFKDNSPSAKTVKLPTDAPGPTPGQVRVAELTKKSDAVKAVQKQQAIEKAAILKTAARLNLHPADAVKIDIHRLALAMIDKEANFSPASNPKAARALQFKLRAVGYKVPLNGRFDNVTYQALKKALDHAERVQHRKNVANLTQEFYGTGGVKAGQVVPWYTFGPLPTPEKLYAELSAGGFSAAVKYRQLVRNRVGSFEAWQAAKAVKLHQIASTVQPFGPSRLADLVDDPTSVPLWMYVSAIGGINDVMPYGDYDRAGFSEEDRLKHLHNRAKNKDIVLANARNIGELRSQTNALFHSTGPDDLAKKLDKYRAVEDVKFKRFQQEVAAGSPSWWGELTHALYQPVKATTTGLAYVALESQQTFYSLANGQQSERDILWEDAMAVMGHDPSKLVAYDGAMKSANPVLRFTLELAADPLNFARPFRAASQAWSLAGKESMGAYRLSGSGLNKALVYSKGTWSKTGVAHSALSVLPPGVQFHNTDAYKSAMEITRRMKQTKDEALAAVSQRISTASAHGYNKLRVAIPGQEWTPPKVTAPTRALLDSSSIEMNEVVNTFLPRFLAELERTNGSLFVSQLRDQPLSQIGSSFKAYMAEHVRPRAAAHAAADVVNGNYKAALARGVDPAEARAAAQAEYEEIMQNLGSFIAGGGSAPELHKVATFSGEELQAITRDLPSEISRRVNSILDDIDATVNPAIQDYLEENALRRQSGAAARVKHTGVEEPTAHPLWDDAGKWAGRQDESDLTKVIRSSFDEAEEVEIRNPLHGFDHSQVAATQYARDEMRRLIGRLDDYTARNAAADTLPPGFDYQARKDAIIKKVTDSWVEQPNGFYHDVRPTLKVSNLYIRHLDGLGKRRLVFEADGNLDTLAVLGENPAGKRTPLENELAAFADLLLGGGQRKIPGDLRTNGLLGKDEFSAADELRGAIDSRRVAVSSAEKEALAKELTNQGAIWRAWQYSQHRTLRYLYRAARVEMQAWKFATLALRPAWGVKNHIDNVLKALVDSIRDPRYLVAGGRTAGRSAKAIQSVFDVGLDVLGDLINFMDGLFNTNVGAHFLAIRDEFLTLPKEVLSKAFRMHNIEVPPEVFDGGLARDVFFQDTRLGLKLTKTPAEMAGDVADDAMRGVGHDLALKAKAAGDSFFKVMWSVVGDFPENYSRGMIWRQEYDKMLTSLADSGKSSMEQHLTAVQHASDKVDEILFDYSRITILEDNLAIFIPFIQFWRKNSVFWAKQIASKPGFNMGIVVFDQERENAHIDQPDWMRRYFHTDEIVDALAVVPGLKEAFETLGLGEGAQFDPLSLASFAPLYRTIKGDNPNLPPDRKGGFLAPFIEAMNDWGLGMSPFLRKPLEAAGVADYRSWQTMFPQTALAVAIGNATGHDGLGRMMTNMEWLLQGGPIADKLSGGIRSEAIAKNKAYWIQTVVAEQIARGEQPDLKKAEETVQDWFMVQNLWGYFGGIYWRRATPEDMHLSQLSYDVNSGHIDFDSMTDHEKQSLKLWGMRGMDRFVYDKYIELYPVIQAYYRGDLDDKNELTEQYPEIIRWVDGDFLGRPLSSKFIQNAARYRDQAGFFEALRITEGLDLPFEVREAANDIFLTKELNAHFKANRTPKKIQEKMIQAEAHDYYRRLNTQYFAIPSTDHDARNEFIQSNPEIVRFWNQNNDHADDYEAITKSAKAELRTAYFRIIEAKGFEAGAKMLKEFPFMFEGTDSEKKVVDGEWMGGGGGKGGKWSAERLTAFKAVKPDLDWFYRTFMVKVGKDKAYGWLETADSPVAKRIKAYLKQYGKHSQKSIDYLAAQPFLKIYYGLPDDEKRAWLDKKTEGAKRVRDYFAKYANKKGQSQHAKDYLAVKADLDRYGKMTPAEKKAWLASGSPKAVAVLAFFKKYSKEHQYGREFKKLISKYPGLAHGTPEEVARLKFWQQYYSLPPDERPAFTHAQAEKHGIFIYGDPGEQYTHDREQEYIRRAIGLGLNERQATYLFVKPLLSFYKSLTDKADKALFLRANPELQDYFDKYVKTSPTGDAKLDKIVEEYFQLPEDSQARSIFLNKHPEVQAYFDSKATPAELAIRNVLRQYFDIPVGRGRKDFMADHPEIQTYFDQKKAERDQAKNIYGAFDQSDPRLKPYFKNSADLIRAADEQRRKLSLGRINRLSPDDLETRRDRRGAVTTVN